MSLFRPLIAALAAAPLLSAPAFAGSLDPVIEDSIVPVPVVPAAPARYDWTGPSVGAQLSYGDVSTEGPALSGDDALLGLRAYYDYDFGNYVLGGGLQYDTADIDLEGVASVSEVLRLGARAGIASGQNWYYGTVGFARAFTDDGAAAPGDSDGYFIGAGYEVALTESVTAGAELLYHQFDDFDIDTLDADVTTLGLSVNYRF
ncbi:MAG: outer membrane beta-barrel protein [Pseudomonadota bacterium]